MALRGTSSRPERDIVTSRLSDLEHRTRSAQRAARSQGRRFSAEIAEVELEPGPRGLPGAPGPPGESGTAAVVAAVATTADDGRAVWVFDEPFATPPVVTATAVDPVDDDIFAVIVNIEQVDQISVTVRVWQTLLPPVPVGPGLLVHLMAVPTG